MSDDSSVANRTPEFQFPTWTEFFIFSFFLAYSIQQSKLFFELTNTREKKSQVYTEYSLMISDGLRENLVVGTWSNDEAPEFLLCQSYGEFDLAKHQDQDQDSSNMNGMM